MASGATTLQVTYTRNRPLNWSTDSQRLLVLTDPLQAMIFERDGTHLSTQKRKQIDDNDEVFAHLTGQELWLLVNQPDGLFWLSHSNIYDEATDEPLIEGPKRGIIIYVPFEPQTRAFKGMELYSWQDENNEWVYSILIGTNREKERSEVEAEALDLNGVKEMISEMALGEHLSWRNQVHEPSSQQRIILPFPPDEIIQELNGFALSHDIELAVATE